MAACFILRRDNTRYRTLLYDLKFSSNRGRDDHPTTLTNDFDLLARESGECDTARGFSPRFRPRRTYGGPRSSRGINSFLLAQQGRGRRENRKERSAFSCTNGNNSDELSEGVDGEMHPRVTCYGCYFLGHYRDQFP